MKMNGISLLAILFASGTAIAATVYFANKALQLQLHHKKGLGQNTEAVTCPHCGASNKRQMNGQHCRKCYRAF